MIGGGYRQLGIFMASAVWRFVGGGAVGGVGRGFLSWLASTTNTVV
jgi:hypothetical protein